LNEDLDLAVARAIAADSFRYGTKQIQKAQGSFADRLLTALTPEVTITGGGSNTFNLIPPKEEIWEIYFIQVNDRAAIDINDIVLIEYEDELANFYIHLLDSNLTAFGGLNSTMWPPAISSAAVKFGTTANGPVSAYNRPNGEAQVHPQITYIATATVGNRLVRVPYAYRRRPVLG
jgi:hypothetical protein